MDIIHVHVLCNYTSTGMGTGTYVSNIYDLYNYIMT